MQKAQAEADTGWTLASAMRHHAFWALFSTFFFTAVGMYAISAQIVAFLIDRIGWRDAYQSFGIIVLCLLVPLMLLP